MRLRSALCLLFLPLLLVGCDSVTTDELNNEFTATISGDIAASLTGDAVYTIFNDNGSPTFALFFFGGDLSDNDEDTYTYAGLYRSGDRPGVGVYAVDGADATDAAFQGSFADLVDADRSTATGPVLTATTGVVTITAFQNGDLNGSFRFDGTGLLLPDTDAFIAATLDGTFEARFVEPGVVRSLGIDFDFD